MEDTSVDFNQQAILAETANSGLIQGANPLTEQELRSELITKGRLLLTCRSDLADKQKVVRLLEEAFVAENAELYTQLEQAKYNEQCAERDARLLTEQLYSLTKNKKPLPGFSIRIVKRLTYDSVVALEWAKVNFRVAVKPESLDKTIFEKYVKGAKNPPEFVAFGEDVQLMISSVLADELAEATE